MWFIDLTHFKNKKFYANELTNNISSKNLKLFYGSELFNYLNIPFIWDNLISNLKKVHHKLNNDLIEIPDFVKDKEILDILVNLSDKYWRKLNKNNQDDNLMLNELFPTRYNLNMATKLRKKKGIKS